MFILDVTMESLIGKNLTKVVRPASQQLNSKMPQCGEAYVQSLECNIVQHRLLEGLNKIHCSSLSHKKKAETLNTIDQEGQDYMIHAEKTCRKIKCCRIPYSPKASIWIRRAQVYYSIIQWHKGQIWNKGNLKRAARRCNIQNPMRLSMAEVLLRVEECKRECKFYQENGKRFRAKHLNKWMRLAQERNNEEAFKKIGAIIQKERQRSFWRHLNYVTRKKRTRSATLVQVEEQLGLVLESTTKDTVEAAIFREVHDKHYMLAKEAPICSGRLFDE